MRREDIIQKLELVKDPDDWCKICDTAYELARSTNDVQLYNRLEEISKKMFHYEEYESDLI